MEATLDLDRSPRGEIVAEEITDELDYILDEVVNMAETVEGQKPFLDNIVPDGEEAIEATDQVLQSGETLELEMDFPIEITESRPKTTPMAEETKSAFDALIDAENEVMDSLAKEAAADDAQDASSALTGRDSEPKDSEKSLAKDSKTFEEGLSDVLPAHSEKSSKDSLGSQDSDS
jgi:hypothetical protein